MDFTWAFAVLKSGDLSPRLIPVRIVMTVINPGEPVVESTGWKLYQNQTGRGGGPAYNEVSGNVCRLATVTRHFQDYRTEVV